VGEFLFLDIKKKTALAPSSSCARNYVRTPQKNLYTLKIILADISYNTVIKLESGGITNPTIETLQKIAKALNVSVDDLLKS